MQALFLLYKKLRFLYNNALSLLMPRITTDKLQGICSFQKS